MNDVKVEDFNLVDFSGLRIPVIVIYKKPEDYPSDYVARVWDANKPTNVVLVNEELENVRHKIPEGMIRIGRSPKDDVVIEEVWI